MSFRTIVLAAVQHCAANAPWYDADCFNSLDLIGGQRPYNIQVRASFAMIGYYGKRKASWVKQERHDNSKGPTTLSALIPLFYN